MKIVVVGCGKIGTTIIANLVAEGHDITAVDRLEEPIVEVTDAYDIIGITGNGVDCETLTEAGVDTAELFIAVTGSDEMNMLGCFIAKRMGAKHTIARIRNPEYNAQSLDFLVEELDLSVSLNPEKLLADEIYNILRFSSATKVESFSDRKLEIVELHLRDDSPLCGMKLSSVGHLHSAKFLVCAVKRGDNVYIPDGNFVLKSGDRIGFTASPNEMQKLMRQLGSVKRQTRSVMILGASKIAYYLAEKLLAIGMSVKIIDLDPNRCQRFAFDLPSASIIHGDGMKQQLLLEEGIDSTDAFVALTGTDEENILASFFASSRKVQKVISKVNRPELAAVADNLGLDCIVSPRQTVSGVISRYARALENSMYSNMETLYKIMDGMAEALEFRVSSDFAYLNIPLRDMSLKPNVLFAGLIRGKKAIIPSGEDVILEGDRVIVLAAGHQISELSDVIK